MLDNRTLAFYPAAIPLAEGLGRVFGGRHAEKEGSGCLSGTVPIGAVYIVQDLILVLSRSVIDAGVTPL